MSGRSPCGARCREYVEGEGHGERVPYSAQEREPPRSVEGLRALTLAACLLDLRWSGVVRRRSGRADPAYPIVGTGRGATRTRPLLHDLLSSQLAAGIDADWSRIRLSRGDLAQIVVRAREFDRFVRDFLSRDPAGTVVHIGCGLDTRFQRVDNSLVRWYDLDLPAVVDLRRRLIPEPDRDHYLATSVFVQAWLADIVVETGSKVLFVAEAVLPYFEADEVRALVCRLCDRFPGSELVTDIHTPYAVRMDNLHLAYTRSRARMRWGVRDPRELESWAAGIQLVESFSYFDDLEPRMGIPAWFARIPVINRATGIQRYLLGAR